MAEELIYVLTEKEKQELSSLTEELVYSPNHKETKHIASQIRRILDHAEKRLSEV
ncbi:hypothetical protein N781_17595 [Pontibacillus halophilus JSM 076056 = DSM 19796]|uniref:Uncharacterized protein n=1 Tax=Pontibacillus halophilus JSM 076056 = DSM 19796 TaxID=1385510 RepID=A0A0A5GM15_9BACI|nr:hypothetical protein [Pontibacillus halophilus]KGX92278.1 hypothetical protein N781_17595 [Pontibacillus halophilus JSM 076056 = DSM 19796]